MEISNILILSVLTFVLVFVFVFISLKVRKGQSSIGAFVFVIMGMLIFMLGSFVLFFTLDTSKGWNPFGWWFLATFIATIVGGLSGLIVYGNITGRTQGSD